ncbi:pyruvate dehydrogenase (acetyl-transferring) E1 component subunit alpha [Candidatus Bathyarchaeota archaeon]|jgi:pyruvate dehydrogenase E1 component alpha subunit|nr:MAG: pyruvate dehydrogenase (acetyl-transferring) E1 component subunit alpha [Candidatus Bathyarchaeota archaeon]
MKLTDKDLIEMYRLMLLTRRFEDKTEELLPTGKLFDFLHTCVGQEHITVGAVYGLKKEDLVMPSLRGRGAFVAKGVPVKTILAVMFGKQVGSTFPKECIHHLGVPERGILVGTGLIGSDIAKATGAALAAKIKGTKQVVLDFFGDGASNRGDFHESLNLAAIWKLPIVYICENNQTAMSTPVSVSTSVEDIADRAAGYGIPSVVIRRNDVIAVHEAVQKAVKRAREGGGPTLIECKTYRWYPHAGPLSREKRSVEEIEEWKRKLGYPIEDLKKQLMEKTILTEHMVEEIEARVEEEIKEAVEFAEKTPFPSPEEALKHVYA